MSHDLIAELQGYRNELASAERYAKTDRADAVREQIARVTGAIQERVDELEATAVEHEQNAQEVLAAHARVEAGRLRRALADRPEASPPGAENAVAAAPRQTATTRKPKNAA